MKSSKVLEMINHGRIEELKDLLRDEVYQDVLKGKHGAKQRYTAMKKYFWYVNMSGRVVCQKPALIVFEGKNYTSFCNSYSLALTKEPCGSIALYTEADGTYPDVGRLIKREGRSEQIDLGKVFAEAKTKGYSLKKSEVNGGAFMMKYGNAYFRMGLVHATYSIIDDGGEVTVYHSGKNVSPITIENDIGLCLILPVKCDEDFIKENGITVIEVN